ncbi:MAG: NADH-quinone oxidoreductase subunit N [Cyanobacteria bacterium P01_H01_bin.150]
MSVLFENNLKLFLPEFFLATAILSLVLYGSIFSVSKTHYYPLLNSSICWISVLTLSITWALVFFSRSVSMVIFNGTFIFDSLSQNGKLLIIGATILCLILCISYIREFKVNSFEYFLLILLAVFGLMLLCSSYDLMSVYLAIELQSLCLYVLAAFNRESAYSTEAGLKYFILGAFSSGLLLFGISVIYAFTGTTNFEDLHLLLSLDFKEQQALQLGIIFLSCAFLFKIAAAPFHIWSPDVYDGAPLNSTIFFAIVPKMGILIILLRVFFFCFGVQFFYWHYIFAFSALASVITGSFLALKQRKLKRLLAYSSIGHVGYFLLAFSSGSVEGFHAAILYLLAYIIMSAGVWGVVMSLRTYSIKNRTRTLADLSMISDLNPLLGFSGAISIFSMAGVPPLVGFYTKFYVFLTSINASMYVHSVLIILCSVVSTYYYIRLIKTIYFEKIQNKINYKPISKEVSLVLGLSFFFTVFFFVNPNFIWLITYEMALSLCDLKLI